MEYKGAVATCSKCRGNAELVCVLKVGVIFHVKHVICAGLSGLCRDFSDFRGWLSERLVPRVTLKDHASEVWSFNHGYSVYLE
jgi:hypothetical protein